MPATRKIMGIGRNAVTKIITTSSALADLTDVSFSSVTQGDVIYYNGSKWVNLGAGTAGQVLTTQGNSSNPTWTNKTSATGIVGGTDQMVQFNDGGSTFGGVATFKYEKSASVMEITDSTGYSYIARGDASSQSASGLLVKNYDGDNHAEFGYNNAANETYIWATQSGNGIKIGTENVKRVEIKNTGEIFTSSDFHVSGTLTAATTTLVATDTIWNAKGDLAVGTASNTAQRLSVGADNKVLTADSSTTTGLVWKTPEASVDTMSLHIPVGSGNSGGNATRFVSGPFRVDPVGGPYASGNVIMRDTHNGIDNTTGMGRLSLITETGSVPLWVGASGTNATVARFGTISNHTGTIEFIQSHKDTPISSITLTSGTTTVGAVGSDHIYRINAKGLNFENDELSAADVGSGLKVWASSSNGLYWRDGLLVNAKASLTNGYLPYVTGAALGGVANSSVYHDSAGRVGINTNSPNRQLDVRGTTLLSGNTKVLGAGEITSTLDVGTNITGTGTATFKTATLNNIILDPSNRAAYIKLQDTSRTSTTASRMPELALVQNQIDSGSDKADFPTIRWQKPGPMAADASYTNLGYRIYVSGESGAGTVAAPQSFIWDYNADVADPTNYTELLRLGTDGALKINRAYTMPTAAPASNGYIITGATDGTTAWVANTGGGGGSNYWSLVGNDIYYTSGNVGINADHPSQKLHVSGNVLFGTEAGVGGSGYDHIYIGDTTKSIAGYGNRLDFYVTSNPRAHINASTFFSATSGGPSLDLTPGPGGTANYGFVDDTDTGMTRSAANTLHLLTAGVSGMTMDSSQNVGIGTLDQAIPEKLYVSGGRIGAGETGRNILLDPSLSVGGDNAYSAILGEEGLMLATPGDSYLDMWVPDGRYIALRSATGSALDNATTYISGSRVNTEFLYFKPTGTAYEKSAYVYARKELQMAAASNMSFNAAGSLTFHIDSDLSVYNPGGNSNFTIREDSTAYYELQADDDFVWKSANTNTKMILTSGGRLGINTTSPGSQLHVSGNNNYNNTDGIRLGNNSTYASIFVNNTSGGLELETPHSFVVDSARHIDIDAGGTTREIRFMYAGTQYGAFTTKQANTYLGLVTPAAASSGIMLSGAAGDIILHPHVTTGNVGIGTRSPVAMLEVSGTREQLVQITSGTTNMMRVSGNRIGFGPTGTNTGAMVHIDNTHIGSGYALRTLGGGIDIAAAQVLNWGSGDATLTPVQAGGTRRLDLSIYDFSSTFYGISMQGGTGSAADHRVGINTRTPLSGSNNAILDVSGSQRLYGSLELVNGAVTEADDTTNSIWASGTTLMWNDKEVYTNTPGTSEITGAGSSTQVAYFDGSSTITSDADMTFDGTNLTLGNNLYASKIGAQGDTNNLIDLSSADTQDFNIDSKSFMTFTEVGSSGDTIVFNEGSANIDFRIESDDNENMFVMDAGNNRIGIGTNHPTVPFNVSGTGYDMATIASSHSAGVALYLDADATGGSLWHLQSTADGAGTGGGKLDFVEAGTSRMVIAGGGNVGIGTVAPDKKLDVRGDSSTWPIAALSGANTHGTGLQLYNSHTTQQDWAIIGGGANWNYTFRIYDQTDADYRFAIDRDGKVGIGGDNTFITNPAHTLDIRSVTGVEGLHVSGAANQYTAGFVANSTTSQAWGPLIKAGTNTSDAALRVQNQAGSSEYIYVRGDGNVGIGTTGPNEVLDVKGNTVLGGTLAVSGNISTASLGDEIRFAGRDDLAIAGTASYDMEITAPQDIAFGIDSDNNETAHKFLFKTNSKTPSSAGTTLMEIDETGNVTVTGILSAAAKSFDIPHPDKEGKRLIHGSLEGPEHGVYVRGTAKGHGDTTIELPDYWKTLVGNDYTLQLTSYNSSNVYIVEKDETSFTVGSNSLNYKFDYFVIGKREKIEVEKDE